MRSLIWLLAVVPASLAAQTWVPYTAHYVDTNTLRDPNGAVSSQTTKQLYETRDVDGTIARFEQVGGKNVSGMIWFTCGDVVHLNYSQKTATVSHSAHGARQHFQPPKKDQPIGMATIADLTVKGWPVHIENGTGAMWYDTANDILAKSEAHLEFANGATQDWVNQLQSIDFNSPAAASNSKLPAGFVISGGSQTCGAL